MTDENSNDDGLPMLDFPSMDDMESKSEDKSLPPDPASPAAPIKEATDEFFYNPNGAQEQVNQQYAMGELKKLWGSNTDSHIKIARFALDSYVDDDIVSDLERSGLGSHPHMILKIYSTTKELEKEAIAMYGQTGLTGKNMLSISMKKMGEKARETLNRAIMDAKTKIIADHGAIPSW